MCAANAAAGVAPTGQLTCTECPVGTAGNDCAACIAGVNFADSAGAAACTGVTEPVTNASILVAGTPSKDQTTQCDAGFTGDAEENPSTCETCGLLRVATYAKANSCEVTPSPSTERSFSVAFPPPCIHRTGGAAAHATRPGLSVAVFADVCVAHRPSTSALSLPHRSRHARRTGSPPRTRPRARRPVRDATLVRPHAFLFRSHARAREVCCETRARACMSLLPLFSTSFATACGRWPQDFCKAGETFSKAGSANGKGPCQKCGVCTQSGEKVVSPCTVSRDISCVVETAISDASGAAPSIMLACVRRGQDPGPKTRPRVYVRRCADVCSLILQPSFAHCLHLCRRLPRCPSSRSSGGSPEGAHHFHQFAFRIAFYLPMRRGCIAP